MDMQNVVIMFLQLRQVSMARVTEAYEIHNEMSEVIFISWTLHVSHALVLQCFRCKALSLVGMQEKLMRRFSMRRWGKLSCWNIVLCLLFVSCLTGSAFQLQKTFEEEGFWSKLEGATRWLLQFSNSSTGTTYHGFLTYIDSTYALRQRPFPKYIVMGGVMMTFIGGAHRSYANSQTMRKKWWISFQHIFKFEPKPRLPWRWA